MEFYEKIKKVIEENGSSIPKMNKLLNLSHGGLYSMFKNNSLRVQTLLDISAALNINPAFWFEEEKGESTDSIGPYSSHRDEVIKIMQARNEKLEDQIRELNNVIAEGQRQIIISQERLIKTLQSRSNVAHCPVQNQKSKVTSL